MFLMLLYCVFVDSSRCFCHFFWRFLPVEAKEAPTDCFVDQWRWFTGDTVQRDTDVEMKRVLSEWLAYDYGFRVIMIDSSHIRTVLSSSCWGHKNADKRHISSCHLKDVLGVTLKPLFQEWPGQECVIIESSLEVFWACCTGRTPRGRPKTCLRNYISHLVWARPGGDSPKESGKCCQREELL